MIYPCTSFMTSSPSVHDDACSCSDPNWITVWQPCVGHTQFWLSWCGCGGAGGRGEIWEESQKCTLHLCRAQIDLFISLWESHCVCSWSDTFYSFGGFSATFQHTQLLPRWGQLTEMIWLFFFFSLVFNDAGCTGRWKTVHPARVWQRGRRSLGSQTL